jgi:hypothetical protein
MFLSTPLYPYSPGPLNRTLDYFLLPTHIDTGKNERQSSDINRDRCYAAREDAFKRELDRYGQSTLSFFRHTWLCGTMGPTSRVEEY